MINFTNIKNRDFSDLTNENFNMYFLNVPESEIAFLSFLNKSFPSKFVKDNWSYKKNTYSDIHYTPLEQLQYYLFLFSNNITILSAKIVSSILLWVSFLLKGGKIPSKKQSSSYKNIENLKINDIIIKIYTKNGKKYINKTDRDKIYHLINVLVESKNINWADMMDIHDILERK